ncbi:MAG: hypothetical protein JO022_04020 [Acidobacteriaceae bacterium]|nr:hypothetical protein [Acidobacteriaceae bacterium]
MRPIAIKDLLTHRAGFTYGGVHHGPIATAYREALGDESIAMSLPMIGSQARGAALDRPTRNRQPDPRMRAQKVDTNQILFKRHC